MTKKPLKTHSERIALLALALPLVFLFGWVGVLTYRAVTAPTYTVIITGYDPRDLVYGQYIAFTFDWENAQSEKPQTPKATWPQTGRFYLDETMARDMERMLASPEKYNFKARVILSVSNQTPAQTQIKSLSINGQPWQQALRDWQSEQLGQ